MQTRLPLSPRTPRAVHYRVGLEKRRQRRLTVQARYPVLGRKALELVMPVWIPGSYLLREFSRNVEQLRALTLSGVPVEVRKVAKNRLRVVTSPHTEAVVLDYSLYAHELSVRTSFVEDGRLILNAAASFFADATRPEAPVEVSVVLPDGLGLGRGARSPDAFGDGRCLPCSGLR